jgi:hypothetical protein
MRVALNGGYGGLRVIFSYSNSLGRDEMQCAAYGSALSLYMQPLLGNSPPE